MAESVLEIIRQILEGERRDPHKGAGGGEGRRPHRGGRVAAAFCPLNQASTETLMDFHRER